MVWIVLAVLESFKAIENDFCSRFGCFHLFGEKEQGVSAQALKFVVDGGRVDFQNPGYLAISHTIDCFREHQGIELGFLLPVGGGKGLG